MAEYKDVELLRKQIAEFKMLVESSENSDYLKGYITGIDAVMEAIDELPAADVQEVRHGYWKKEKNDVLTHWHCTVCEKCYYLDKPKDAFYCPHCGARMDGDTNT